MLTRPMHADTDLKTCMKPGDVDDDNDNDDDEVVIDDDDKKELDDEGIGCNSKKNLNFIGDNGCDIVSNILGLS